MSRREIFVDTQDQLIGRIYEAAASPQLWPSVLTAFAQAAGAIGSHVIVFQKKTGTVGPAFIGGPAIHPSMMDTYVTQFAQVDPLIPTLGSAPTSESWMLCHEYISDAVVARSPYYQDFLIPGGCRYMAGWNMEQSPDRLSTLALHQRKARFDSRQIDPWAPIAHHVRRALSISTALMPRLAAGELLRQAIDAQGIACVMVDSQSRVIDCSEAAAALLNAGRALKLHGGRYLAVQSSSETRQLRTLIQQAASGRVGGIMLTAGLTTQESCVIQVAPCGVSTENTFDARYAACALLMIRPLASSSVACPQTIEVALGCTHAEAEIAALLADGQTPATIAAMRNVSIHTVRTQIRGLLDRTNLHRTADLISLLSKIQ
jgi:DNA-binding CsgD family transcriptional regulator/PAS domain-containing protein